MKKICLFRRFFTSITAVVMLFVFVLGITACNNDSDIINTYIKTPVDRIQECYDNSEYVIKITYYEMSDGTWKTDDYTYKYKLELTGRLHSAVKDSTYVILSNSEDITFEQAWRASGLSSNTDDYFKPEEAVIVATK